MAIKYDYTTIKNNLEKKGYCVRIFKNKKTATEYMNQNINHRIVGIGGSVTIAEMGLFPVLSKHNTVYWHDQKPENMTMMETRSAAARADVYISSVNGISELGEIVNIDNTGNRVAAISYGPSKVYLVIGVNKITSDLDLAIYRARNIAAPLNAQRLKKKTPCAIKGDKCYDCKSPERICRNISILLHKPSGADYEIIFIDEDLGY